MSTPTHTHCQHGFDWRNACPHGCVSHVTTESYAEWEVHILWKSGSGLWKKFDSIEDARSWMAAPWVTFPGYAGKDSLPFARMTLYRRIVEPWEAIEDVGDHPGWHRTIASRAEGT